MNQLELFPEPLVNLHISCKGSTNRWIEVAVQNHELRIWSYWKSVEELAPCFPHLRECLRTMFRENKWEQVVEIEVAVWEKWKNSNGWPVNVQFYWNSMYQ